MPTEARWQPSAKLTWAACWAIDQGRICGGPAVGMAFIPGNGGSEIGVPRCEKHAPAAQEETT